MKRFLLCFAFLMAAIACHAVTIGGVGTAWIPGTAVATSPYFPSAIPTDGLVAAYRKGDWHLSDATHVDVWYDRIGGYNATQTTALNQPPVNASGTLDFISNSVNSHLVLPDGVSAALTEGFTAVIRCVNRQNTDYRMLWVSPGTYGIIGSTGVSKAWRWVSSSDVVIGQILSATNTRSIFAVNVNFGSSATSYAWDQTNKISKVDNFAKGSFAGATTFGGSTVYPQFPPYMKIEDLWIYNRALTDAEIDIFRSLP